MSFSFFWRTDSLNVFTLHVSFMYCSSKTLRIPNVYFHILHCLLVYALPFLHVPNPTTLPPFPFPPVWIYSTSHTWIGSCSVNEQLSYHQYHRHATFHSLCLNRWHFNTVHFGGQRTHIDDLLRTGVGRQMSERVAAVCLYQYRVVHWVPPLPSPGVSRWSELTVCEQKIGLWARGNKANQSQWAVWGAVEGRESDREQHAGTRKGNNTLKLIDSWWTLCTFVIFCWNDKSNDFWLTWPLLYKPRPTLRVLSICYETVKLIKVKYERWPQGQTLSIL